MNEYEQRRLYADEVEQRRRIERRIRLEHGWEPSTGSQVKRVAEGILTGILIADFFKAMRG